MTVSTKHRRPRWMTVLAIPTFVMPALFLVLVGWLLFGVALNTWEVSSPDWLYWVATYLAIGLCLLLWPVYIVWVVRSTHLTSHEKRHWVGMIVFGNIIGMPMFYIFMMRRYQGTDALISPKEAARVEKFCVAHGICQVHLTPKQYHILAKYVRGVHSARWTLVPMVLVGGILLYMAFFVFPQLGITMFSEWLPIEHRIVVDNANTIQHEYAPDQEVITGFLQTIMMFGAASAMVVMMAFIFVAQSISQLFVVRREVFIEFLQVTSSTEVVSGYKG
ncbi:MAG: hypothetical protein GY801_48880 [bacterium]|nr:hypothetical protein [bacterium]